LVGKFFWVVGKLFRLLDELLWLAGKFFWLVGKLFRLLDELL
jgi:hypothetical protein